MQNDLSNRFSDNNFRFTIGFGDKTSMFVITRSGPTSIVWDAFFVHLLRNEANYSFLRAKNATVPISKNGKSADDRNEPWVAFFCIPVWWICFPILFFQRLRCRCSASSFIL